MLLACVGECEVVVFCTKHWDCRSGENLIKSATRCHDAHFMALFQGSNSIRMTVVTAE